MSFARLHFVGSRSRASLLATLAMALACVAGGFAYYVGPAGSGTGALTGGATVPWTVSGASNDSPLWPAAGADVLSGGTVSNTSPGMEGLNQIVATITGTSVEGCATSNYAFTSPGGSWATSDNGSVATLSGSPIADVAPGSSYTMRDLEVEMVDTGENQDVCETATVFIHYVAS